jgi:hypothetical protein
VSKKNGKFSRIHYERILNVTEENVFEKKIR